MPTKQPKTPTQTLAKARNLKISELIHALKQVYPPVLTDELGTPTYADKTKLPSRTLCRGVVVALDVDDKVIDFMLKHECNLLITHHLLHWHTKADEKLLEPHKQSLDQLLRSHRLYTFGLHEEFDEAPQNDTSTLIARKVLHTLGVPGDLVNYYQLSPYPAILRTDQKIPLISVVNALKEVFGAGAFQANLRPEVLNNPANTGNYFMFMAGSGSMKYMHEFLNYSKGIVQPDLVVTSDIKWSEWQTYRQAGLNVVAVPHNVEAVFINEMAQQVRNIISEHTTKKIPVYTFESAPEYWNI
ncbi:Nif3-like dinuclear metal center hexameric protein [Mycoplasmopsis columbinasalis]|uniref:GTP cyclohydrolase 1 type 2 homolog n=1 Tax=Mycoplasmopsis columbinasalis TaxID=114880 RepID=A0A449B9D8_9BACT|nr:Nif3-like dinuclear metal center hexameric protein [Mycoplasmopsis columbinasalis]VEU77799.1 Uncharacterized protein conserved in bacteria [Mycoplasmopsis columbinasalis]